MFCDFDLCSDIPNTDISHFAKTTAALTTATLPARAKHSLLSNAAAKTTAALTTATLPARANLVMLHHCPLK